MGRLIPAVLAGRGPSLALISIHSLQPPVLQHLCHSWPARPATSPGPIKLRGLADTVCRSLEHVASQNNCGHQLRSEGIGKHS